MVTIIAKKFQLGVWQVPKYAFLNKTVFQQSDCFFQIFCVKCVDKVSSGKNVLNPNLYNLLVSSKFHDPKIFVGLIFWISFFQNSYWFLQCQHFSFFFFACLLLEKWIYLWQYYSYLSPECLEKGYIIFCKYKY